MKISKISNVFENTQLQVETLYGLHKHGKEHVRVHFISYYNIWGADMITVHQVQPFLKSKKMTIFTKIFYEKIVCHMYCNHGSLIYKFK